MRIRLAAPTLSVFLLISACEAGSNDEAGLRAINGTHLYCNVMGSGEPIVVLHGGPGLDHTYLLPQMAELAKNYRLIFYDQRLAGRSSIDVDSSAITMQNFIDDIEGIRREFKLEKVNLLAHSWGSFLALNYGIKYPQNLKSLILVSSAPASSEYAAEGGANLRKRITSADSLERAQILQSDAFRNGDAAAYEQLFRITFRATFYDRSLAESLTLTLPPNFAERSAKLRYMQKDVMSYDLYESMGVITCPTLIIHGENDATPKVAMERMQENIPGAQLVWLKNCGHFPYIETPADFFKLIRDFVK
jgi:proline iminopeptidase